MKIGWTKYPHGEPEGQAAQEPGAAEPDVDLLAQDATEPDVDLLAQDDAPKDGEPKDGEPKDDAPKDDVPDVYEIPEAFSANAEAITAYAKEHNLTQDALNAGLQLVTDMSAAAAEQQKQQMAEGMRKLQTDWGQNFDTHLGIAKNAIRAVDAVSKNAVTDMIKSAGLNSDPRLISLMFHVGTALNAEGKASRSRREKTPETKSGWDLPVEQVLTDLIEVNKD